MTDISLPALRSLTENSPSLLTLLSNASAYLYECLPETNWAGFYLLRGNELILGPFQGKVACVRIDLSRGVCGRAATLDRVLRVDDVHAFPGHIACDAASRSEIVIPLHCVKGDHRALWGVLDIDSPVLGRFSSEDEEILIQAASVLEEGIAAIGPDLLGE